MSVGSRLREIRSRQHRSLRAVARAAGFSASFLSQVEREIAVPSIPSLRTIADVLGVPVFTFFVEEEEASLGTVLHPDQRRIMAAADDGQSYELLTPALTRSMEMMILTLAPGAQTAPDPRVHDGEEGVLVLAGEVLMELCGRVQPMREGDSSHYAAHLPHRYVNASEAPCRILFCMTPPA